MASCASCDRARRPEVPRRRAATAAAAAVAGWVSPEEGIGEREAGVGGVLGTQPAARRVAEVLVAVADAVSVELRAAAVGRRVDDEMGSVGAPGDLRRPADLVDRPVVVGVVGVEAADPPDPDRVQDPRGVAHPVGVRVARLDVNDRVRERLHLAHLVAQVCLPLAHRAVPGDAARRADRVELQQVDGRPAPGGGRHLVDPAVEHRVVVADLGCARTAAERRVHEIGGDDRDRAGVGPHVLAEDLLDLAEDLAGAAASGVDAEPLRFGLAGDLRQLGDLVREPPMARDPASQAAGVQALIERGPGQRVRQPAGIDPQQVRDRPGGAAVRRTVDEEVGAVERIGAGRDRKVERVGPIAPRRIRLCAVLPVGRAGRRAAGARRSKRAAPAGQQQAEGNRGRSRQPQRARSRLCSEPGDQNAGKLHDSTAIGSHTAPGPSPPRAGPWRVL